MPESQPHILYLDGPRNQDEHALMDAARLRQQNADTLSDMINQAVTNLEQAWANWDTLTPAQKDQAVRLNLRVTAGLARLQLRKLDTAG